eukprot:553379_1
MGNQHTSSLKIKIKNHNHDEFFIQHVQNNKRNELSMRGIESLDLRRVVFVSLLGLYQTWRNCPSFLLYTAIFILPLKRKWIYKPSKYIDEMKSCLMSRVNLFLANVSETKAFIELLRWKDRQGLVCWALDEYNHAIEEPLVRPFWRDVSSKLTNLYNHVTRDTYKSLNLDANWWRNEAKFTSKFDTKASNILSELYFCTMKFRSIQEIIFQSNPHSLHAVQYYSQSDVWLTNDDHESATNETPSQTHSEWVFCDGYSDHDHSTQ